MSHAMCVRGLKQIILNIYLLEKLSHAMCVRGLKLVNDNCFLFCSSVARHVRAWIETSKQLQELAKEGVARHVRAWIETQVNGLRNVLNCWSHAMCVRGLKLIKGVDNNFITKGRTPCACVD